MINVLVCEKLFLPLKVIEIVALATIRLYWG